MQKKFVVSGDIQFEQIIEQVKVLCKKVDLEKEYIFTASKLCVAENADDDFSETYSIDFTFKDYQMKHQKPMTNLNNYIAKEKFKDIILIDPSYVPGIGDEFQQFDAKKQKINIEAKITKKKGRSN